MATRAPLKVLTPPPPAATNTVAELDIREAKAPVAIPNTWAWVVWGLVLAALMGGAWWGWRKWRRARAHPPAVPPVPPHTRAREKLQAALRLLSQPDAFCVAVSDALRTYLEERFDLHAPERTTEEFLLELQTNDRLDADQKARLAEFLSRCDLVKFAQYEPTEVELLELHAAALRLVDETEARPFELRPAPFVSSDTLPPEPGAGGPPAVPAGRGGEVPPSGAWRSAPTPSRFLAASPAPSPPAAGASPRPGG
jgi:hypothetical protein